jgi:sterol desaturase/sphingolipid hydroxylase (fatty acid hydroxylase superfamily)
MPRLQDALIRAIERFPKGSIWQSRFISLPLAIVASTLALAGHGATLPFGERLLWFVLGVATWIPAEYVLHRWVLHWRPRTRVGTALLRRFHIQHHDDPADQSQVCIPAILGVAESFVLYAVIVLFGGGIGAAFLYTAGLSLMMVVYDIAHFSAHYMPATNPLLKYLKKHHMLHHFSDHSKRFGVTSPFMDFVFGTHR